MSKMDQAFTDEQERAYKKTLIQEVLELSDIKGRLERSMKKHFARMPGGAQYAKAAMKTLPGLIQGIKNRYDNCYTTDALRAYRSFCASEPGQEFLKGQEQFEDILIELTTAWLAVAMRDATKGWV